MGDKQTCEECGYDASKAPAFATDSDKKAPKIKPSFKPVSKEKFWANIEKDYVIKVGKWAWILPLIFAGIFLILDIVAMATVASAFVGFIVWTWISIVVSIVFAILWIRPKFSPKCVKQEWQALVDDAIQIKNIRIRKCLLPPL